MTRKFIESLDNEGGDVISGGTYTVEVVDARALEDKAFLWMDLKIVGGPDADRVVSVGLNVPDDNASRGAIFHFKKKIRGFIPEINAAKVLDLPDDEQPGAIADAILGAKIEADLSIQSGGNYDGSQQLDETRQFTGIDARPAAPAAPTPTATKPAATETAAEPEPETRTEATDAKPDDDVPF